MNMNRVAAFQSAEDGAVTVDWVVLTAAIVAFGAIAGALVTGGTMQASSNIGSAVSELTVDTAPED